MRRLYFKRIGMENLIETMEQQARNFLTTNQFYSKYPLKRYYSNYYEVKTIKFFTKVDWMCFQFLHLWCFSRLFCPLASFRSSFNYPVTIYLLFIVTEFKLISFGGVRCLLHVWKWHRINCFLKVAFQQSSNILSFLSDSKNYL